MKNLLLVLTCLIGVCDAYAATRPSTTMTGAASSPVSRSSRTAPVASRTSATTSGGAKSVSARSATARPSQPSTQPQSAVRGRSATTPTSSNARAATKQNVISTGTKVAAATQNTVVDEVCWTKFSGCMDSFCMLDNANGGRCICSDKNAEFDSILAEIQELDNQSYQMATVGVERLEMGDDADAVMSKTDAVTKSIIADSTKPKRQSLDLSSWDIINVDFDADAEDIFSLSSDGNSMSNKTGDALYRASAKLCNEQIPECASQSTLMDLMYKQRVRSDCTAYENSLRQQRTQSAQKLASAQSAMREAALEQYRAANKYDLGQCTVEFKKCMQTTGGCGDDFTGCVTQQTTRDTLLSKDTTNKYDTKAPGMHSIKGKTTNISIAKWTYDALESKKPLCMGVTKQCANVANQVWDTFLREVAPQVKSAELMAESDLLTSCVSNISGCFQRACRENIDPNDPDGSYDACLTRPEVFEKVCSVEIDPCDAAVPNLMDYVRARLASMRVDSCTREFKSCLQSEDRCGEDYTQCVGLDTDTIVRLCPADKLIGCQYKDGDINKTSSADVYNRLAEIAQGIFLNIDNNMLSLCQAAAQKKFIEICGDVGSCASVIEENPYLGTESLVANVANDGGTVITGLIDFGQVLPQYTKYSIGNEHLKQDVKYYNIDERHSLACTTNNTRAQNTLTGINAMIERKFGLLLADPTVSMCVTGRYTKEINKKERSNARFPHLLDSYSAILFDSILGAAENNYNNKYTELFVEANNSSKSATEDYKNTIYCNRLALLDDFDDITMSVTDTHPSVSIDECKVQISGGPSNVDMLEAMKQKNSTERVLTAKISSALKEVSKKIDAKGQVEDSETMVGLETINAAYESGPKVCRITRTVYACASMTTVSDGKSTNVGVSASYMGTGGGVNVGRSITNYKGAVCDDFVEPVVTEQLINMSSGNVVAGNVTRSNLTSQTIDNSVVDNSKTTSLGLSGSVGSIGNKGTIDNSNISNIGSGSAMGGDTELNNTNSNNTSKTTNKSLFGGG